MFKRVISTVVCFCFLVSTLHVSYAQLETQDFASLRLPEPGVMVNLSPAYEPVMMKGLKIDSKNPFRFEFIIDTGHSGLNVGAGSPSPITGEETSPLRNESNKLIKYFLASLTIPEKDLWVNLSPYEKDRMIASNLAQTEMGRDMLAQDYILKQLTASLIYPEKDLGKAFWDKVYAKAQALYGNTNIPVNTFNKVWIVADKADVFEKGNVAYVVGAHLKVMLETDYLAMDKNVVGVGSKPTQDRAGLEPAPTETNQIVREIVLPALETEINTGKNFAPLRQMFYSMILASWYKLALKDVVISKIYGNQSKVKVGINQEDAKVNDEIFSQYLKAYKKGVFNYIKEDIDRVSQQAMPRKYFSGGLEVFPNGDAAQVVHRLKSIPPNTSFPDQAVIATVDVSPKSVSLGIQQDAAMATQQPLGSNQLKIWTNEFPPNWQPNPGDNLIVTINNPEDKDHVMRIEADFHFYGDIDLTVFVNNKKEGNIKLKETSDKLKIHYFHPFYASQEARTFEGKNYAEKIVSFIARMAQLRKKKLSNASTHNAKLLEAYRRIFADEIELQDRWRIFKSIPGFYDEKNVGYVSLFFSDEGKNVNLFLKHIKGEQYQIDLMFGELPMELSDKPMIVEVDSKGIIRPVTEKDHPLFQLGQLQIDHYGKALTVRGNPRPLPLDFTVTMSEDAAMRIQASPQDTKDLAMAGQQSLGQSKSWTNEFPSNWKPDPKNDLIMTIDNKKDPEHTARMRFALVSPGIVKATVSVNNIETGFIKFEIHEERIQITTFLPFRKDDYQKEMEGKGYSERFISAVMHFAKAINNSKITTLGTQNTRVMDAFRKNFADQIELNGEWQDFAGLQGLYDQKNVGSLYFSAEDMGHFMLDLTYMEGNQYQIKEIHNLDEVKISDQPMIIQIDDKGDVIPVTQKNHALYQKGLLHINGYGKALSARGEARPTPLDFTVTMAQDAAMTGFEFQAGPNTGVIPGVETLLTPQEQRLFYDTHFNGRKLDDQNTRLSLTSLSKEFLVHYVDELMKIVQPGQRLLSVGEGQGDVARELMNRGVIVSSIDISQENTKIALGLDVNQKVGDATRLAQEYEGQDPFDVVLFSESLGGMPLQEVINQAYKVLKPSGKILISAYRRNAASIKNYAKRHFMDYSSDDIFRALGTAHFVSFTSKPIYLKPLDSENLKSNDLAFDLYEAIKPKDEGDLRLALDEAMATKGGIDFDSSKMQLNVSKEGRGVQMEVPARGWSAFGGDQAMVDRIKGQGFDGLEFTIRSIEPVQNLPAYLGISLN